MRRVVRPTAYVALISVLLATAPAFAASKTSRVVKAAMRCVGLVEAYDAVGQFVAQGSGFIVTSGGAFVTNYHVVAYSSHVIVRFPSGHEYTAEGVLAADSEEDLVLLKLSGGGYPYLRFNSSAPEIGDDVLAIGSPLGYEATVSKGIISGFRPRGDDGYAIQTTAPISPGSSGGPLLDSDGRVVGVTSSQLLGGQNLNFAIPAADVMQLFQISSSRPRPFTALLPVNVGDELTLEEITRRYGPPVQYSSAIVANTLVQTYVYANVQIRVQNNIVVEVTSRK